MMVSTVKLCLPYINGRHCSKWLGICHRFNVIVNILGRYSCPNHLKHLVYPAELLFDLGRIMRGEPVVLFEPVQL